MRGPVLLLVLSAAAVTAAYGDTLPNGFHFDDGHSIQDNTYLEDPRHIPRYFYDITTFSPLAQNRSYRPILLVGFALSEWMGKGAPWAYHLITLLLHTAGAVFVGLVLHRLLRTARPNLPATARWVLAGGATVVFAAHPLTSEPVNYISSRSSLQAAVLVFLSVLLCIRSREESGRPARWGTYVALGLALLTKLTAVTVPALLLLWELTIARKNELPWHQRTLRLAPLFGLAAAFAVLHETIVGSSTRAARSAVSPYSYFLTETRVWQRFMGLFVWPSDLCADLTMRWSQSPWEWITAQALVFSMAIGIGAYLLRRRFATGAFGIAWFYVTLAPTNSIVPLAEPASEHRVYIALPGLIFAVADLAGAWLSGRDPRDRRDRRSQQILAVMATLATVALITAARLRSRVWRDDVSLWGSVIQCAPDNGRAHLNYGRGLWAAGDLEGARGSFARCRELWPAYPYCPINLAALALRQDRLADAARHAAVGLQLAPHNVYAHVWVGKVALARKDPARALRAFAQARRIGPGYPEAEEGHAVALFELGRLDEAQPALERLEPHGPRSAGGWYARGFMHERSGNLAPAEAAYGAALRLDPNAVRARYRLARLLHQSGRLEPAIAHYRHLVSQGDPNPEVQQNLETALQTQREARRNPSLDSPGSSHPFESVSGD